ncbi:hypothetical protein D9M72_513050 [compost metagenome]
MLHRAHCIQGNRNADVVRVGVAAGHGAHGGLGCRPPEKQETGHAVKKPHDRCREQRQRGVRSEGRPDIAAGHHGEQERRVGDVIGGSGQRALDFRSQNPEAGGEIAHGNHSGDDEYSGDNPAQKCALLSICMSWVPHGRLPVASGGPAVRKLQFLRRAPSAPGTGASGRRTSRRRNTASRCCRPGHPARAPGTTGVPCPERPGPVRCPGRARPGPRWRRP